MGWLMCLYLLIILLHSHVNCSSSFSSNSTSTQQLCPHEQSFSLLHFKNTFSFNSSASPPYFCDKSFPKMLSWEEGTDCCSWDGITCNRVTGHVIGLDLSCSQLIGTIHSNSSLFLLPYLQRLNLAGNDFNYSQISSQFGRFASLTHLNLSSSRFLGHIPSEIFHLSKLVSLDLSRNYNNRLDAPNMKRLVQNLTEFKQLSLGGVDMSTVEVGLLRNLSSSLTSLSLENCGLRGKFPDNIFHLPNLQTLRLRENYYLTGYFPKVNRSSPLEILDLWDTSFSGEVPDSIKHLQSLNYLDLRYCNFSGYIPTSLGNLTQITYLGLSQNHFIGEIPSSLANLGQLNYLGLSSFNFSGPFPSFVLNLTRLVTLGLSHNELTGPIPSLVLPNLKRLFLPHNSLDGTIPSWVFTLPSLMYLDLSHNQLTGQILEFQHNSLEYINLENNELHGPIPRSIFQLVNLTLLRLSSNNLSGIVEMNKFSKLQNLDGLDLSYNRLSLSTNKKANSTLPKFWSLKLSSCNLTEFPNLLTSQESLEELDLSNNNIHGHIPNWVWDMGKDSLYNLNLSSNFLTGVVQQLPWKNLYYLDLHSNLLQGQILYSICNASSLEVLNLSNNSFSGMIPQCLGNFNKYLSVLDLRMNKFHGSIPATFTKDTWLRNLALNGNQLEGRVPPSLINCRYLEVLDLGNNKINETFPYWLDTLPELHVLVLQSNRFHGPIKHSKATHSFPKLRILDLSDNDFSGPLPMRYIQNFKAMMNAFEHKSGPTYMGGYYYHDSVMLTIKGLEIELVKILTILTTIDLSNNRFQGEIPNSIGKLRSLRVLNFSHNNLTGHIPSLLDNLRVLESLDLSSNNLTGEIPGQLTSLTFLEFLNLSQNHLVGRIPRGNQFNTFQNDSYSGNLGLCGDLLTKKCSGDEVAPPPPLIVREEEDVESASGFTWKVVVKGFGCGVVFGLVMGCLMFVTGKPKWLVRIIEDELFQMMGRRKKSSARRRGGRRN